MAADPPTFNDLIERHGHDGDDERSKFDDRRSWKRKAPGGGGYPADTPLGSSSDTLQIAEDAFHGSNPGASGSAGLPCDRIEVTNEHSLAHSSRRSCVDDLEGLDELSPKGGQQKPKPRTTNLPSSLLARGVIQRARTQRVLRPQPAAEKATASTVARHLEVPLPTYTFDEFKTETFAMDADVMAAELADKVSKASPEVPLDQSLDAEPDVTDVAAVVRSFAPARPAELPAPARPTGPHVNYPHTPIAPNSHRPIQWSKLYMEN